MKPEDYLDDNEIQALKAFNTQETMKQAVKKVLLAGLYENGVLRAGKEINPQYNGAFGLLSMEEKMGTSFKNEDIGADLRAQWAGISQLQVAFGKIDQFITEEKVVEQVNPAV